MFVNQFISRGMNIEELREYCLQKRLVTEGFPFDETTLVFKVAGKMFALTNLEGEFTINLKCDPQRAIDLRERYSCVKPGYHMSKKHWNTIEMDDSVSDGILKEWIDHSYDLIVSGLPKKLKKDLLT